MSKAALVRGAFAIQCTLSVPPVISAVSRCSHACSHYQSPIVKYGTVERSDLAKCRQDDLCCRRTIRRWNPEARGFRLMCGSAGSDGACPCRCVARERRPGGMRLFSDCSPSSAGSFLAAFARAARGSGRTPMVLSCRASPKYPGCVIEPQADGRGSPGVSRRLPLEAAACP